jgi:O-antigen/teichoic acid export membrane protein
MIKEKFIKLLRQSEKYTETDMLYAVKGSFWIVFGRIGILIIAIAKMVAFGRYADQEVYGTYTFILSMATMLGIFSLGGISTSIVKAISQKKDGTLLLAIKERLKFSLLGSFASLVASGWYLYNQNYPLAIAFLVVALFLPTQNVFSIFSSFWIGRQNFSNNSKYELLSALLVALVTIPVIVLTNNPILMVVALFASQSLFNGILLSKTLKQKENNEVMPEAISFGKNLTAMGAIALFASQVDKIILWKFFGPIPLAIYSFAQIPIQHIQGVIPIGTLAFPKIGERAFKEIKEGLIKKFKKLFIFFIPLTISVIIIAPYAYKIVLPQYVDSVPYFQAFSLLLLFSPFVIFGTSLLSEMKKRELYIIQIVMPLSKIAFFLILIPFLGIWGIIFSIIISELIGNILVFYFFKKL